MKQSGSLVESRDRRSQLTQRCEFGPEATENATLRSQTSGLEGKVEVSCPCSIRITASTAYQAGVGDDLHVPDAESVSLCRV